MISHRHAQKLLGQHVQCHTVYGTFHGVIVHSTSNHLILAPALSEEYPGAMESAMHEEVRWGPGPGGPAGPGGPMGPQGPGPGGGGGGGWHMAIPLAAILGITVVGMHWW